MLALEAFCLGALVQQLELYLVLLATLAFSKTRKAAADVVVRPFHV
jgi:hypothetical protein